MMSQNLARCQREFFRASHTHLVAATSKRRGLADAHIRRARRHVTARTMYPRVVRVALALASAALLAGTANALDARPFLRRAGTFSSLLSSERGAFPTDDPPAPLGPESDLVTNLPGFGAPPHPQYSGFLDASAAEPGTKLHYWFAQSSRDDYASRPVVLWLNGGPGSSSVLGWLQEMGPLLVNRTGGLMPNPWAWTLEANVLALESPAGVGYSYCEAQLGGARAATPTTPPPPPPSPPSSISSTTSSPPSR